MNLPAGTMGIAIIGNNALTGLNMDHDYTNGAGGAGVLTTFASVNGVLTVDAGTASNFAFTAPLFDPRIWNGRFCEGTPDPGTNYCTANNNSTGTTGVMSATGTNSIAANDMVLTASNLPTMAFGFFLTSQTQGFVPNPGGSDGNLCLGGAIGRFVGPGQIMSSGAGGVINLTTDNTAHPTSNMGLISILVGDTWSFTCWHRDATMAGSNFADGYEVTYTM